jgi:hypothetical protein
MMLKQCTHCGLDFYGEEFVIISPKCKANMNNEVINRKCMWNKHYQPISKEAIKEVYEEFNVLD